MMTLMRLVLVLIKTGMVFVTTVIAAIIKIKAIAVHKKCSMMNLPQMTSKYDEMYYPMAGLLCDPFVHNQ